MIYRTSHRATYRQMNDNLGLMSYRMAELNAQMASQKRINSPSDDPGGAAQVLGTRSTLASIKQYQSNLGVADSWLNDSGAAVQSIKNTLDDIYAKSAIQGSTDTYDYSQKAKIMAEEVEGLFASLIQFGNSSTMGSYIFGGQSITDAPFSLQVEAQQVIMGDHNSDGWGGSVVNYGDEAFNSRPDLPEHGQNFIIEVVQAGGVDSRYYSDADPNASGQILGDGYRFDFQTTDPKYNNTEINFVAGHTNKPSTGSADEKNGLTFINGTPPDEDERTTEINYVYGDSSAETTVSWLGDPDTAGTTDNPDVLTVYLRTKETQIVDGDGTVIGATHDAVSSAEAVMEAINTAKDAGVIPNTLTVSLTGENPGTGTVKVGQTSFNHGTTVEVDEDTGEITVYLEQDLDPATGQLKFMATANEVREKLEAATMDEEGNPKLNITLTLDDIPIVSDPPVTEPYDGPISPTASGVQLQVGQPYTLAHTSVRPKGTQNDTVWSVKNDAFLLNKDGKAIDKDGNLLPPDANKISLNGETGNDFSVEYRLRENPFQGETTVDYNYADGSASVVVNVAVDSDIYQKTFVELYNSPNSGAYQDSVKANEMALNAAIKTTANEVRDMVAKDEVLGKMINVDLADGSSGEGKINRMPKSDFIDGYDQPALFRVSQDGGKTWGPPTDFAASEYENGDMFYNSTLGHASFTTSMSGEGNDLVFTAKHQGTWGNDLRVAYNEPQPPQAKPTITVGPELWNICVNLGTTDGNVTTTAEDIMNLINNHPQASQLISADLANYHDGGGGVVKDMKLTSLVVGEPYQSNGKSNITKLGYADTTVEFPYSAPEQKSPDMIFQALEKGEDGNDIGIRYTTSADPTFHISPEVANNSFQSTTTVRYETIGDETVMVVHLATKALPSCPDEEKDREGNIEWKDEFPLYSCKEDRAVISTSGAVMEAIVAKNMQDPANAVIWPQFSKSPDGWDPSAKVGPTDGTQWLTGGEDQQDAADHGVNLKFIPDGTALQVGDTFEVPVGWYSGDDKNVNINTNTTSDATLNIPGNSLFGNNGEDGNIFDTVQRLIWGLKQGDSALVGESLPKLKEAIEQITTVETKIGTRQVRNEFSKNNLALSEYNAENFLSATEDVDFTTLINDLKNAEIVYEAMLGGIGMTSKISLLNYI